MADGHFPTLVSKDRDANAVGNPIFTSVSDGTDSLAVNADGSINAVVTATDLDIRDLTHVSDSVKIGDGTDFLAVNADGSINVVATINNDTLADDSAFTVGTSLVYPFGALADETTPDSVDEGDVGIPRMTLDRKLLTRVVGATDANRLDIDASGHAQVDIAAVSVASVPVDDAAGSLTVDAVDLDIRNLAATQDNVAISDGTDTLAVNGDGSINAVVTATDLDIRNLTLAQDAVQVSANGTANSQTNPIFVQVVDNAQTGEVHDYDTASAVASDATSNHDYTVTSTLKLKKVTVASSGGSKFEIQVGPVASLVSRRVGFIPKEGGYVECTFDPAIEVPSTSTGTVRVIRTNRQGQAQDLYSSIEGIDN